MKFKTSSPSGDLLATLPGIKQLCNIKGIKATIYQRLDVIGQDHAYRNENGDHVCMNRITFDMMRPLLLTQEYIEDFIVYEGQEIDVDIDKIRLEIFTNQPKGSINRWPFYVFPEMNCNLSEVWISTNFKLPHPNLIAFDGNKNEIRYINNKVIINFTDRYRNHLISYFFLKQYEDKLVFAGLKSEYDTFCKQWGLKIPLLEVPDFRVLAGIIEHCMFFLGNASMCFQIAEGLKKPRILELFEPMPNVIPQGANAYDFYHQSACEYYFQKLINK